MLLLCICMLGGDPCCYCHVYHVPHAIDAIFLISSFHACAMSCELFMPTICTNDMLAMIPPSMLHLRTSSLLDLITMIDCFVASPMFHSYSLSWVDEIYALASHMIYLDHSRLSPLVPSLIPPCIECQLAMLIDRGDLDMLLVKHACLLEPIVFGCSRIICLHTMKCSLVLSYDEHDAYTCWVFTTRMIGFALPLTSFVFLSVCHVLSFWRIHKTVSS